MFGQVNHSAFVDSWIDEVTARLPQKPLRDLYEQAVQVICSRTKVTLGETTLGAIMHRVACSCKERFPWVEGIYQADGSFDLQAVATAREISDAEIAQGLRNLLLEILNLIGALTGDALVPQLCRELSKIGSLQADRHSAVPVDPEHRPRPK